MNGLRGRTPKRISGSESHVHRTEQKTYGDGWLSTRDLLTFRNARAHIRRFISVEAAS